MLAPSHPVLDLSPLFTSVLRLPASSPIPSVQLILPPKWTSIQPATLLPPARPFSVRCQRFLPLSRPPGSSSKSQLAVSPARYIPCKARSISPPGPRSLRVRFRPLAHSDSACLTHPTTASSEPFASRRPTGQVAPVAPRPAERLQTLDFRL